MSCRSFLDSKDVDERMKAVYIVVHHTAEIDTPTLQWNETRLFHMHEKNYLDIGYHAGTELVEDTYENLIGRAWTEHGAHTIGHNHDALGFVYCGNFSLKAPDDRMLLTGMKVILAWMEMFQIPLENVLPHSHFNATECPGKLFGFGHFKTLLNEESDFYYKQEKINA
jgi:hypothetical protein